MSLPLEVIEGFAAALPAGTAPAGLAEVLAAAWTQVKAEWPDLLDGPAEFFRRVAPRLAAEVQLGELAWADLALADACLRQVPRALEAFEARHADELDAALAAAGIAGDQRAEALQRLRLRLFVVEDGAAPRLASYAGRGPLRAWLRVAAVREALMLARASKRRAAHEVAVEDGALLEHAALADDPELLLVRERCRDAVQAALHAAVAALDGRERTLMRLTLRDGLTVDQLGALFQVHRATAARWLAAVRAKLRATVRERLVTTLNLGTGEVDSFIQAIGSRIDLSLAGQFEHTTPT